MGKSNILFRFLNIASGGWLFRFLSVSVALPIADVILDMESKDAHYSYDIEVLRDVRNALKEVLYG